MSSAAASPMLVIGSGSSVVTWDCRNEDPSESDENLKSFSPFVSSSQTEGTRIADLAWNHNGQVLACCSTSTSMEENLRKNIVLMSTHSGSTLDSFRHTDSSSDPSKYQNKLYGRNSSGPAATCVAFGGKSRYLCIGDQQGDVCLWDLKKQSRVRQFKSKKRQPCVQACLDPTATYVCALSSDTFTLYHLRQATFASQWNFSSGHSNKGGWNQFRFSPLQPTLMALGDDMGRIQLHDGLDHEQPQLVCGGGHSSHSSTSTSLLPHHASPITGLAFSTQNSKLLANVRRNGILEFVDTSTGEVIHHQQTGGNASALAFQGVSCVVGTETGEVQVYDLRKMMQQFGKAVTTYRMPKGDAVTTLEFAPIPKASGSSAHARSRTRSRSPPSRRTSGTGNASMGLGNAVSFDLESRASMTSYTEPPLLPQSSSITTVDYTMSLKEAPEDRKPTVLEIATTPTASNVATAPPTATSKPPPEPVSRQLSNSSSDLPPPNPTTNTAAAPPVATSTANPVNSIGARMASIRSSSPGRVFAQRGLRPSAASAHSNTSASAGSENTTAAAPAPSSINSGSILNNLNLGNHKKSTTAGNKGPSPETAAFLQNMVRSELQSNLFELKEEMNSSIRNLHVDMIRQFQAQSHEMMEIVKRQQIQIDQLMQENEFLRESNATLSQQQQQQQHQPQGNARQNGKNGFY